MNQIFETVLSLSAKKVLNFVETEYTEFISIRLDKYNNMNSSGFIYIDSEMKICGSL